MADAHRYVARPADGGTLYISEDVLSGVAASVAAEAEGVAELVSPDLLGSKTRGARVHIGDGGTAVDIWMRVVYGHPIPVVAKKVQAAVIEAVSAMTGAGVGAVRVHVVGVQFPNDKSQ